MSKPVFHSLRNMSASSEARFRGRFHSRTTKTAQFGLSMKMGAIWCGASTTLRIRFPKHSLGSIVWRIKERFFEFCWKQMRTCQNCGASAETHRLCAPILLDMLGWLLVRISWRPRSSRARWPLGASHICSQASKERAFVPSNERLETDLRTRSRRSRAVPARLCVSSLCLK